MEDMNISSQSNGRDEHEAATANHTVLSLLHTATTSVVHHSKFKSFLVMMARIDVDEDVA